MRHLRTKLYPRLLRLALGLLASTAPVVDAAPSQAHSACGGVADDVALETLAPEDVVLTNVSLFPSGTRVYEYELNLASESRLPLEEVVGITRNFADAPVTDGSTGVYRLGRHFVFDVSSNLLGAYKWALAEIQPGALNAADVVELRNRALQLLSVGRGRDLVEVPPARFKTERDVANVRGPMHPEVAAKLRSYGYEVSTTSSGTRIRYTRAVSGPTPLERYVAELNRLVAGGASPERVAAFAVQELLLIHPFDGGNGRTARLLGQALYRKLTGKTLLFPAAFHRELSFSLDELTRLLHGAA
jgi:hypothetical protein